MAAGHLQNTGYMLIAKEQTKYLYYYFDMDLYTTCSWENTNIANPLTHAIAAEVVAIHSRENTGNKVDDKLPA
jgi:hypothetical protein